MQWHGGRALCAMRDQSLFCECRHGLSAGRRPPLSPRLLTALDIAMRALPLAMLGLCALLATPAAAQSYGNSGSPVCMQVFGPFNHIDCSYASMEQCRSLATARA